MNKKVIAGILFVALLIGSCSTGKKDLRKMKHSLDVKLSYYFDDLTNKNKMKMYLLEPRWRREKISFNSYDPHLFKEREKGVFVSAVVRNIKYDLLRNRAIVRVHFMKGVRPNPHSPVILKPVFIEEQLWVYRNGEWGFEKTLKRIHPSTSH